MVYYNLQFNLETREPEPSSWIAEKSHGGLVRGTDQLEEWVRQMEEKFNEYHVNNKLKSGGDIIRRTHAFIQERLKNMNIPEKIVKTFVNVVFHYRHGPCTVLTSDLLLFC